MPDDPIEKWDLSITCHMLIGFVVDRNSELYRHVDEIRRVRNQLAHPSGDIYLSFDVDH
jgi:hypothetical protein